MAKKKIQLSFLTKTLNSQIKQELSKASKKVTILFWHFLTLETKKKQANK